MVSKDTFRFLSDLKKNNSREWFHANKSRYEAARAEFEKVVAFAIETLAAHDPAFKHVVPKDCMFRINRDVRFAKDKTPYNHFFRASITPSGKKSVDAGYYLHVEPGNMTVVGGGLYCSDSKVLNTVRRNIAKADSLMPKILDASAFKKQFGGLWDDQLKTYPRGFSESDPNADLLKYKSFVSVSTIPDERVASDAFQDDIVSHYHTLHPFISWLNQAKKR